MLGRAGIGSKDREDCTEYASTGTLWDVRSWEARVWFLKSVRLYSVVNMENLYGKVSGGAVSGGPTR